MRQLVAPALRLALDFRQDRAHNRARARACEGRACGIRLRARVFRRCRLRFACVLRGGRKLGLRGRKLCFRGAKLCFRGGKLGFCEERRQAVDAHRLVRRQERRFNDALDVGAAHQALPPRLVALRAGRT